MDTNDQDAGAIVIGEGMPDTSIPVLSDGPAMDLPPNATLQSDGSVVLTLTYPATVEYRLSGTDKIVKRDDYTELTFRRLKGPDVRKMLAAKDSAQTALALSSGLGVGKLNILQSKLDAADEADAHRVVKELMGANGTGLPAHATSTPDGVTLPLFFPCADEAGNHYSELVFGRMTAFQRKQATNAPDILDWGVALATGTTPKLAHSLIDEMDGADVVAVNHVILFLFGSGR